MAWTSADLVALEAAIATGATSVKFADRQVNYRSLAEMLKLRDLMISALASPKRKRFSTTTYYDGGS